VRECTYSATRLSLYPTFKQHLGGASQGQQPSLPVLLAAGACAGACGAVVGNPADIIKTRQMTAVQQQQRQGLLGTGAQCMREGGGVRALWRGVLPAAQRAAAITAAQLGSYDFAKRELSAAAGLPEGPLLHCSAAAVAGLVATAASSPFDVVKTQFYTTSSQRLTVTGALLELVQQGGLRALLRGFAPAYARLGLHTLCTLTSLEAMRKAAGFAPL
jgi:dicarboxylate transporter 10